MKLEHSFEVGAPAGAVWETLINVERVAPCLPGAEITKANDDGSYEGSFQVKLGPTTASYTGKLSMDSLDEEARRATMKASGRDKRGQGSANATIVSTVHEAGGATRVDVETDFTITGRLARFGRGGMMQDISNRLLRDFAQCLRENLEAEGAAGADAGAAGATAAAAAGEEAASAAPGAAPSGQTGPTPAEDEPPRTAPEPAPSASGQGAGAPAQQTTAGSAGAGPSATGSGAAATGASRAPMKPVTSSQPAKPIQGISLVLGALLDRIKRLISQLRAKLRSRRQ